MAHNRSQVDGQSKSDGRAYDPLERVEFELPEPYLYRETISGTPVEMEVNSVTIPIGDIRDVFGVLGTNVIDETLFLDFARARDYTIEADGDVVIDGGEERRVSWLQDTLCAEVGVARCAKRRLMDAGFSEEELDELANTVDQSVTQFYREVESLTGPENIAKSIALNASDDRIVSETDIPNTEDVRCWIDETRESLNLALDAVDTLEEVAMETIGEDEYQSSVPQDDLPTDIEVIRTRMYDSDQSPEAFAQREHEFEDGSVIRVETGPIHNEVVYVSEDGEEDTVMRSSEIASIISEFSREVQSRR